MSNGAQPAAGNATYRMLRELGSRAQHSYAALREPRELVVAQRFVRRRAGEGPVAPSRERSTLLDAESMAFLLRDARCLAKNGHPNIARVRHVDLAGAELTVASELVEGATLADLLETATERDPDATGACGPVLPLPVLVRILLDVLAGLQALHGLRDGMNTRVGAIHGELCPANVVVGTDGVARIVNVLRRRPVRVGEGSEAVAHASPEALALGGTEDVRADVYAVGVMLWEGLAGRRLYEETDPAEVLARQRAGDVAPPAISGTSPFARLADAAMRALSLDPAQRFPGPAEMAAELRKIAGARLAPPSVVAALVTELAGDEIRALRDLAEPAVSGTRRTAPELHVDVVPPPSSPSLRSSSSSLPPSRPPLHASPCLKASAPLHLAPPLPAPGTPGDFVIPIDVTETLNEMLDQAPRRRRRLALIGLAAAAALVAMGSFAALRSEASRRDARSRAAASHAPPPAPPLPPLSEPTAIVTTPAARPPAPAPSAAPSALRSGTRAPAPPPPAPSAAPAKSKKSVYEPDAL